jgi:hypothetical protein
MCWGKKKKKRVGSAKDWEMHDKMAKFTAKRDEQLNKDVEGQLLAKLLSEVRLSFGADSIEYNGIRELLISGFQVEELQGRFLALEEGRVKYPSTSPEWMAYRGKLLHNPNTKKSIDDFRGGIGDTGVGQSEYELEKIRRRKKKKKKKKKKGK